MNTKNHNPYESIKPEEWRYIWLIAERWQKWARDWKRANARDDLIDPDTHILAMDVATVHISKPLHLFGLFIADDLAFIADCALIAKNIDRQLMKFPADVKLKFQRDA